MKNYFTRILALALAVILPVSCALAQNVGIGVADPEAKLEIHNDGLLISSDAAEPSITFRYDDDGTPLSGIVGVNYDGTAAEQYVFIGANASVSNRSFTLYPSGFIGIGAPAEPTSRLTVAGDIELQGAGDELFWTGANSGLAHRNFGAAVLDGPVLYGNADGALGTVDGGDELALVWDASGQVGIGRN